MFLFSATEDGSASGLDDRGLLRGVDVATVRRHERLEGDRVRRGRRVTGKGDLVLEGPRGAGDGSQAPVDWVAAAVPVVTEATLGGVGNGDRQHDGAAPA